MFKHKIENTYRHISKKRAVLDLHSVAARRAVIYILIHHNVPQSDRGTPKRTRPSGSKACVPHALHYEAKPRGPDARSRVRVKSGAQTGGLGGAPLRIWPAPLGSQHSRRVSSGVRGPLPSGLRALRLTEAPSHGAYACDSCQTSFWLYE